MCPLGGWCLQWPASCAAARRDHGIARRMHRHADAAHRHPQQSLRALRISLLCQHRHAGEEPRPHRSWHHSASWDRSSRRLDLLHPFNLCAYSRLLHGIQARQTALGPQGHTSSTMVTWTAISGQAGIVLSSTRAGATPPAIAALCAAHSLAQTFCAPRSSLRHRDSAARYLPPASSF